MTSHLVLFDIDGTLVLSGRAGLRGMNLAFEQLHGRKGALDGIPFAGRTDRAIVLDAFRAFGHEPDEADVIQLRDRYCDCLSTELKRPVDDWSGVLPGVAAMLDSFASRADAAVGLLTGNFARGAAIKLGHFGLWERFGFGAFGDDHANRRDLVPIAIRNAAAKGFAVSDPGRVIVIGDTPLDVDCAKAHGANAIAVATGTFDRAALEASGADLVLDTLDEAARFGEWLARH